MFSKAKGEYFKPVVSKFITVRVSSESEGESEEEKEADRDYELRKGRVEGFRNHTPVHGNLENKCQKGDSKQRSDNFEPFKEEEISLIEMRDSNEGKLMTEQELREMGELDHAE